MIVHGPLRLAGRFAFAVFVGRLVIACGTDAVGVDSCRQIEEARCHRGPGCGITLQPPYFTAGSAVDACIRAYDDACLHGLDVSDPGPTAVNACVVAIQNGACSIVEKPESSAACVW
ncbi:MAG: hypothetical protein ACREJ3_06455, partial [Polyangiaceae bacterium]